MLRNRSIPLALMLTLMATAMLGCTRPWNTAHTALDVTAEAVASTDAMVAAGMVDTHTKVRAAVVAEARAAREEYESCTSADPPRDDCGERPTVEQFLAIYEERVQTWEAVTTALEVLREVLLLAESAVTAWRDLKQQPEEWGSLCTRLGEAQASVVRAIEACDVDVPDEWEQGLQLIEPVCSMFAPVAETGADPPDVEEEPATEPETPPEGGES
jgi:hypothetical protein